MEGFTLGNNRIHRNIMRLRIDCRDRLLSISDAKNAFGSADHFERPIEVTAAISQSVTFRIETNDRRDDDVGNDLLRLFIGDWDVPDATYQRSTRTPKPENQRLVALYYDRQGELATSRMQAFDPRAEIRFTAKWPVAAYDVSNRASDDAVELCNYTRRVSLARFGVDRETTGDQTRAFRFSPACDILLQV